MKKTKSIFNIVIALGLVVLVGCNPMTGKKVKVKDEKSTKKTSRTYNPLSLVGDSEIVPKAYPQNSELAGDALVVDNNLYFKPDSSQTTVTNLPDAFDTLNSQAYRVQLFSSKVYGEARKEITVAKEIFDRPLFMDYEVPYYKIRVGNFSGKESAEQYLMRVRTAGYTNAWIVVVTVNVKDTTPLYNDDEVIIRLEEDSTDSSEPVELVKPVEENDEGSDE